MMAGEEVNSQWRAIPIFPFLTNTITNGIGFPSTHSSQAFRQKFQIRIWLPKTCQIKLLPHLLAINPATTILFYSQKNHSIDKKLRLEMARQTLIVHLLLACLLFAATRLHCSIITVQTIEPGKLLSYVILHYAQKISLGTHLTIQSFIKMERLGHWQTVSNYY